MSDQPPPLPQPGWYRDPTGQGDARYWNGVAWTPSVSRGGVTVDIPIAADRVGLPPVPGSEYRSPAPPAGAPGVDPRTFVAQTTPPPVRPSRSSGSSGSSGLIVALIAGVAVIALLVVLFVVLSGDDEPEPGTPTTVVQPTTQPAPTAAPTPEPTAAPADDQTAPEPTG